MNEWISPVVMNKTNNRMKKADIADWISNSFKANNSDQTNRILRFQENNSNLPETKTFDDSSSTISSSTLLPEAPDGGYGWIIVIASFLINFIGDGVSNSFGVIFPAIQDYFEASKTLSGIVASLFLSVPLLCGPFAGALTDIYDCRRMTIIGGFIAAAGSLLSFFASNIWIFSFTFAIVTAIGLSFCFNTAIVSVTFYFQKKRALATSLAVTGSGIGTVVLAPVIETVLNGYGWRTNLLCIGFLFFLLVICGLLIKDLEWPQDTLEYKRRKFIEKADRRRSRICRSIGEESSIINFDFDSSRTALLRNAISLPDFRENTCFFDINSSSIDFIYRSKFAFHTSPHRSKSVGEFLRARNNRKDRMKTNNDELEMKMEDELAHLDLQISQKDDRKKLKVKCSPAFSTYSLSYINDISAESAIINGTFCRKKSSNYKSESILSTNGDESETRMELLDEITEQLAAAITPSATKNIETKQNRHNMQFHTSYIEKRGERNLYKLANYKGAESGVLPVGIRVGRLASMVGPGATGQNRIYADSIFFSMKFEPFANGMNRRVPSAPAIFIRRKRKFHALQLIRIKESIIDWISGFKSLVIVPTFFTFLVSTFISSVFFDMPYVNFPEYAVKKHNASEAISSYLVSSIGITNMISTIACGLIADWKFIKPCVTTFYGIFVLLAGFCVAVAPFAQNYTQLLLLCSGFGVFISANHALSSVITVNLLCLYDFQTGFGILSLVEGIGSLIGPALVGFIYDSVSTYDNIFLIGGIATMFSGLLVLLIDIYLKLHSNDDGFDGSDEN